MSDFRRLSDSVLASPQIAIADVEEAKAQGVTMIVCNRPDGEDPGQPAASEVETAARAADMDFAWVPVSGAGFGEPQVAAMAEALERDGKVLAYCRSGTRSTLLWALAQARGGRDPQAIATDAAAAGYDVAPVRAAMDMLAARAD